MVTVSTRPRRRRSAGLAVDVTTVLMYQSAMAKVVRNSAYWQGRLEREHPEIAERLRSGEIPSVRAAAIEAGLIRERKPLDDLRRAWAKAARGERRAFLAEVGATAPVVDHDRLAKMSADELSAELRRVVAKNEPWATESAAILSEIERRHDEAVGLHRYSAGPVDLSTLEE